MRKYDKLVKKLTESPMPAPTVDPKTKPAPGPTTPSTPKPSTPHPLTPTRPGISPRPQAKNKDLQKFVQKRTKFKM